MIDSVIPASLCGTFSYAFVQPLDSIFDDSVPYFFTVYFEDFDKADTYDIDLIVSYTDYPTVYYTK